MKVKQLLADRSFDFSHVLIGLIVGAILGAVLFFNVPSIGSLVLRTLILSVFTGFIALLISGFRFRGLAVSIVLIIGVTFVVTTGSCDLGGVLHPPAENKWTGEIETEGFDGFRVMGCDKGHYPWYYEELSGNELAEFCEEVEESVPYCDSQVPSPENF